MHHGLNACKRNGISRECCTGRAAPGAGMAAGRQSCSTAGERGLPGEKKPKQPGGENREELGIAEFGFIGASHFPANWLCHGGTHCALCC